MLIIDQMDVLSMQNWDHVSHIFEHTHLQPSQSHGVDFSRVRMWSLNGLSKYYRQTLIFSSLNLPEVNALFNKKCWNFCGRVKNINTVVHGSICQVISNNIPIVFRRFNANSIMDSVQD